ncbi:MAG: glycosyltransferase family 2 protein [Verrucomicrobiota bacterium]
MKVPVAFFIFKRPETTRKVLDAIRQVKPEKIFVIADGARQNQPGEAEKCVETRSVIETIDWDCEVFKDYSSVNLGCARRVSSGLDWVFGHVENAIILEDDCVPDLSFFEFCGDLLEKYKDDERVFSITGHNHLESWKSDMQSYHFSNYFDCWGWATWRRVWRKYDLDMALWSKSEVKEHIRNVISDDKQFLNRSKPLDATHRGEIDSWAYPFFFMCLLHEGLTITPATNLIKNIGFGENSTNTKNSKDGRANISLKQAIFPLRSPDEIEVDRDYDYYRYKRVWEKSFKDKVSRKIKKIFALK